MEPDHPTAVLAGIALGEIRVAQARYAEAEELYRAALFATRRREGPSSLRTTETGNMLASFLRRRGRGEEAVALYRAQLADMEQHGEQESDTYPQVQMRLAATLMDAGANDEARALLDGALPALREGDLHAERRALLVLSILCREQQDCARILEILPRMREVALAYHGSAQPSLVEDLESIALDAQLCEDTGLALSVQEQAVDLAAEHGSLDARELSLSRWRLSWYRARTGDFEGARASARSALLELGELDAALTPLYELTRDWLGLQLGDVERATVLEELDALGGQGWELPPPALSFAELRRAVDAVR
jgi:hypothetical protein